MIKLTPQIIADWTQSYIAMDKDGKWHAYDSAPTTRSDFWDTFGLRKIIKTSACTISWSGDWKESLHKPSLTKLTNELILKEFVLTNWSEEIVITKIVDDQKDDYTSKLIEETTKILSAQKIKFNQIYSVNASDYCIVNADEVCDRLKEGWELYGYPFASSLGKERQAMIRRDTHVV